MTSQNVWTMSLFEHFFKILSLYLEARIRIRSRIKVTRRIRNLIQILIQIRIKLTSRIWIRIKVMRIRNTAAMGMYRLLTSTYFFYLTIRNVPTMPVVGDSWYLWNTLVCAICQILSPFALYTADLTWHGDTLGRLRSRNCFRTQRPTPKKWSVGGAQMENTKGHFVSFIIFFPDCEE